VVRRAAPLLLPPPPGGEDDTISHCASDGVRMSDISVGWMVLPYFIVGVGECLVAVPLYDVCYSEAPASLRSIAQVGGGGMVAWWVCGEMSEQMR
jgi:dipeptide/tripeptide permease